MRGKVVSVFDNVVADIDVLPYVGERAANSCGGNEELEICLGNGWLEGGGVIRDLTF